MKQNENNVWGNALRAQGTGDADHHPPDKFLVSIWGAPQTPKNRYEEKYELK